MLIFINRMLNEHFSNQYDLYKTYLWMLYYDGSLAMFQVHRLYELGHYEDVVQLLMPTLHQPQPKTKVSIL